MGNWAFARKHGIARVAINLRIRCVKRRGRFGSSRAERECLSPVCHELAFGLSRGSRRATCPTAGVGAGHWMVRE